MIAKISKGSSFGGAVDYVLDKGKDAELLAGLGVRMRDNESITRSFEMQAALNPNLTKLVGHVVLAFSVQDAQYSLFAFLAASAAGTVIGGPLGDRIGRKYVIWGSILGAAPFALMLPYAGSGSAVALAILVGLIISSAFSAIVVYATDLMPGRVGMIAGLFFGLMFGLGGLGSAFFGWLADRTSIEFIFRVSALLPLMGIITGFLPDVERKR